MAKEITDLQIHLISLVNAGANNKTVIYKDKNFEELLRVSFSKNVAGEEGIVYGIVYAPDEVDSQGEFANAAEIKKAAYDFMKRADLSYCVDVNHDLRPAPAYICESWIVKEKDAFFSETGAWAVGIKLEDEDLRARVKSGELSGLSMYGSGVIKSGDGTGKEGGMLEAVRQGLREFFNKKDESEATPQGVVSNKTEKGEEMNKEEITELIKAKTAESDEKMANLEKSLEDLGVKLGALQEQINKSAQDTSVSKQKTLSSEGIL
nr:MAG TPA: serine protease [Caudoviricetes sp.]